MNDNKFGLNSLVKFNPMVSEDKTNFRVLSYTVDLRGRAYTLQSRYSVMFIISNVPEEELIHINEG